METRASTIS